MWSACAISRPLVSQIASEKSRLELRICEYEVRSMASPISFTIDDRRCWTTERVIGSILADILAFLARGLAQGGSWNRSIETGIPSYSQWLADRKSAGPAKTDHSGDQQVVIDKNLPDEGIELTLLRPTHASRPKPVTARASPTTPRVNANASSIP
ncbi:hypothetical protein ACVMIH_008086 [Bradyrhizobium sp. USDA 4503]